MRFVLDWLILKKKKYDGIEILCGIVITLVSIYLTLGLIAAVISGIQVANGEDPIIALKACCCSK